MITNDWLRIGLVLFAVGGVCLTWVGALLNIQLDKVYGKDEKRPMFTIFNSVGSADFSWRISSMRKQKGRNSQLDVLILVFRVVELLMVVAFISIFFIFAALMLGI